MSRFPVQILIYTALGGSLGMHVAECREKDDAGLEKTRSALLKVINKEREAAGGMPLSLNPKLTKAAQQYAEYLAESGEFSHTAKGTIKSRVKDAGYDPKAGGENIAIGQTSPAEVITDWMDSEGHKKNILSEDYTEVGFGIAKDKDGNTLWVADFGDQ